MLIKNSFKYYIGYGYHDYVEPYIKRPRMIEYVRHFDSNKTMSFKIIGNKVLKSYSKIYERVSSLLHIEFHNEPIYGNNHQYIKTNFQVNKILKENASYKSLSLIILDSVSRVNKDYYPQTLLEECKYVKNK